MKILEKFDEILKKEAEWLYVQLNMPVNSAEVWDELKSIGISDESLVSLYCWRNGVSYNHEFATVHYSLFSFGVPLPLDWALSIYESDSWMAENNMFPVFGNYSGDYVCYNIDTNSPEYGRLHLYSPGLLVFGESCYDSLESLFATIISCYESKAYIYDSGSHLLEENYELCTEISRKLNPFSDYWK